MRKISKLKGVVQPMESSLTPTSVILPAENIAAESPKIEMEKTQTTERKAKRKERVPRSAMAKHLDRVLAVSVASLIILAVIYHFEQKNQILERAKGFIEAKIPFLLG